ncbi:malectin [Artemisia annua]|uniref:Malectin n=1 Tax=Artemisia annua TaxID=35608 RepID=A0A2U1PCK3_ARTAN|nr:malectin [Artemisia annua]
MTRFNPNLVSPATTRSYVFLEVSLPTGKGLTAYILPPSYPAPARLARTAAMSLTYYALHLMNRDYTVRFHYAEVISPKTAHLTTPVSVYSMFMSRGRELEIKDFEIVKEAGGAGRPLVRSYMVNMTNNTLKIQLYWAEKGTIANLQSMFEEVMVLISEINLIEEGQSFYEFTKILKVVIFVTTKAEAYVFGCILELDDADLGFKYSSKEAMTILNVALLYKNASLP